MLPAGARIDAMIARPSLACPCGSTGNKMKKGDAFGFTQSPRFGWWVHAKCHRPTATIVRNFIANLLGGYRNLMADIDPSKEWPQLSHVLDRRALIAVRDQYERR